MRDKKSFGLVGILLIGALTIVGGLGFLAAEKYQESESFGASVLFPYQGGTGTSTVPASGQILIANTNLVYGPAFLTAGSNITITTSSGGIELSAVASSFSTSTSHQWSALQSFRGGINFTTATGTSATSTLSAFSADFQELRVVSSTITATLQLGGVVSGNLIVNALTTTNTLNVTSTSVFGAAITGTSGVFSGAFSVNTLNVTSTSVFVGGITLGNATSSGNITANSLNVTNANEYRTRSASVVIVNPNNTITPHSSTTLAFSLDVSAQLVNVQCYSRPSGTSTIQLNRRVMETPNTAGTNLLSASLTCGTSNASTTSFAQASVSSTQRIHIELISVAGAPSSTTIFVNARNDD